ncbi:MAG: FAD:protein FMN transferase [Alphaproteobacteria bacterium]|nr:FAD:protein FMN transferase [Alphaproteobacteria bacterium]
MSIKYQKFVVNGQTMGTYFSATFFAELTFDAAPLANQLQAAVQKVDQQMSNWKADSDLTKFNQAPCDIWQSVPTDMLYVIAQAQKITRLSHGAFDITVGDLVNAWGFGPPQPEPNAQQINQLTANQRPDSLTHLQLDKQNNRLLKSAPLTLDLCGIAKGYGVDKLAETLEAAGIKNYLVAIDGEMRATGEKPQYEDEPQSQWNVAIEQPLADMRDIARVIELKNAAIATSGDYRHMREFGDQIVSHSIDKNTASPVINQVASVSVIANNCMLADAWATALMIMGEAKGPEFAKQNNMNALFIIRDEQGLTEIGIGSLAD